MYYADLTEYQYLEDISEENLINIGWLDEKHVYCKGTTSEEFLDKLFDLCLNPVNQTRGYHQCPFCNSSYFGTEAIRNGQKIMLGSAEIRVHGTSKIIFATPDLIYHYVKEHSYIPPDEFIESVLSRAE